MRRTQRIHLDGASAGGLPVPMAVSAALFGQGRVLRVRYSAQIVYFNNGTGAALAPVDGSGCTVTSNGNVSTVQNDEWGGIADGSWNEVQLGAPRQAPLTLVLRTPALGGSLAVAFDNVSVEWVAEFETDE